jgi:cell fate regulator YaaT (PSP1 superfamily)
LCCKSTRPLPSVDMEAVIIQSLEWRDIEKLKWRCGKLKCSLIYEVEQYLEEKKRFPPKWSEVENNCGQCWFVVNFNIMSDEVIAKTSEWEIFRSQLADIRRLYKEKKKEAEELKKNKA